MILSVNKFVSEMMSGTYRGLGPAVCGGLQ